MRCDCGRVAASVALLGIGTACLSAPFDGTGTLVQIPGDPQPLIVFYWDGGVFYALDRFDLFTMGDRIHVQGDLVDNVITVGMIDASGPFRDCGRLESEEFCSTIFYCGRYNTRYVINTFGGFVVSDSVRVTMSMEMEPPYSICMDWPKWIVSGIEPCSTQTPTLKGTWGYVRQLFR